MADKPQGEKCWRGRKVSATIRTFRAGILIEDPTGQRWHLAWAGPAFGLPFSGGHCRRPPKGQDPGRVYYTVGEVVVLDNVTPFEAGGLVQILHEARAAEATQQAGGRYLEAYNA